MSECKCQECGMIVEALEYHPYAACLMFRASKRSSEVRINLKAVQDSVVTGHEAELSTLQSQLSAEREANARMEKAIKAVTQYRSHCTSGDDIRCLVPIRFINELAALEGKQNAHD